MLKLLDSPIKTPSGNLKVAQLFLFLIEDLVEDPNADLAVDYNVEFFTYIILSEDHLIFDEVLILQSLRNMHTIIVIDLSLLEELNLKNHGNDSLQLLLVASCW